MNANGGALLKVGRGIVAVMMFSACSTSFSTLPARPWTQRVTWYGTLSSELPTEDEKVGASQSSKKGKDALQCKKELAFQQFWNKDVLETIDVGADAGKKEQKDRVQGRLKEVTAACLRAYDHIVKSYRIAYWVDLPIYGVALGLAIAGVTLAATAPVANAPVIASLGALGISGVLGKLWEERGGILWPDQSDILAMQNRLDQGLQQARVAYGKALDAGNFGTMADQLDQAFIACTLYGPSDPAPSRSVKGGGTP